MAKKKTSAEERYYTATQWQLMWRKIRKHKLAIVSGILLTIFYVVAIFCEFFSPYNTQKRFSDYAFCPPQRIHFFGKNGKFHLQPFICGIKKEMNPDTWEWVYAEDKTRENPICFFVHGEKYKLWNLFETDIHFFGIKKTGAILLFGADKIGRDLFSRNIRDLFSRNIYAARISLSIGLVGVALSFILGVILGGISGFYGGAIDMAIQRVIEFLISIPTLRFILASPLSSPLWAGAA